MLTGMRNLMVVFDQLEKEGMAVVPIRTELLPSEWPKFSPYMVAWVLVRPLRGEMLRNPGGGDGQPGGGASSRGDYPQVAGARSGGDSHPDLGIAPTEVLGGVGFRAPEENHFARAPSRAEIRSPGGSGFGCTAPGWDRRR